MPRKSVLSSIYGGSRGEAEEAIGALFGGRKNSFQGDVADPDSQSIAE